MGDTVKAILSAAAIIGALIVIGQACRKAWGVLVKLARLIDDLAGEPARDGFPERPGVLGRLARIEQAVVVVEERVAVVPALEAQLAALAARLLAVETQLATAPADSPAEQPVGVQLS